MNIRNRALTGVVAAVFLSAMAVKLSAESSAAKAESPRIAGRAAGPMASVDFSTLQQAIDAATRAELISAREAVWRAYFQGDSATLVRLLPEKMVAMDEDRAAIIASARTFTKGGNKYLGMRFTNDQFFVNGNTAIIWSNYVARTADAKGTPDERSGRAIELFVKVNGQWINPHWHLDEGK